MENTCPECGIKLNVEHMEYGDFYECDNCKRIIEIKDYGYMDGDMNE